MWPKLKTRSAYTKTLIDHIRKIGEDKFAYGDATQLAEPEKCNQTLASLERIADDHYKRKYPRKIDATYTGFPIEMITEGIDELVKRKK